MRDESESSQEPDRASAAPYKINSILFFFFIEGILQNTIL